MPEELNQFFQHGMSLSVGAGALVALAFYIRRIIKGMGLEDAHIQANTSAVNASDAILQNLQAEVMRLSKRVEALEDQVTHLSDKLANVRLVALECYEIALSCECDSGSREQLLARIRDIIKEA